MSVHGLVIEVAGEMWRRNDFAGLEQLRNAQIAYSVEQLRCKDLRGRKRRKAEAEVDRVYRETVAALSARKFTSENAKLRARVDGLHEALERIAVCCDNGSTDEKKLVFVRRVSRDALQGKSGDPS